MAELKVEVVKLNGVTDHPNADRMDLAFVHGYQVCVQKGSFKAGDLAVYIPVDAVLPEKLEALIFGPNSKVKLHNHRVKCIKLRGAMSQGMLIDLELAAQYPGCSTLTATFIEEGMDCTKALDITKYQPPVKAMPNQMKATATRASHHSFTKYTNIDHLRKNPKALEGEHVYITEKIHGTNFRCGWVPFVPRTWVQKLKNLFGLNPKWEFVYGSHNVQLMDGGQKTKDAFADNVYKRIVKSHGLRNKINVGQLWYGEIFGDGIQTGYSYGLTDGNVDVAFMDIKDSETQKYMDFSEMVAWVESKGEQVVPYSWGAYDLAGIVKTLNDPDLVSFVDGKTKPVEGFVVRTFKEKSFYGGRSILKLLNDEYLLRKENSDWK